MSNAEDQSLKRIAKGTSIAFIGLLIGLFSAFFSRLMVARYGTEAEYGIFSLALVILNICAVIGTLGLQEGASRTIAYARGKKDSEKVKIVVSVATQIGFLSSMMLCIIVFFTSDFIATKVFNVVELSYPLKLFALGIPFFTLLNILVSIFRGFDNIKPKFFFQDILKNTIPPLLLIPIILLSLDFTTIFYAYLASLILSCSLLVIYAIKHLPITITAKISGIDTKELLIFSLPLLGVAILQMLINWTDTLMLGWFKSPSDVGLYNTAFPLARFISSPLRALLLIYTPVISGLFAQELMKEIRINFTVFTKWICSATLPLFLLLFLYPELTLNFLFGAKYVNAAVALRILSLGFIISNFLGPNGATLLAMGEPRFLMWATLTTVILNIGLNICLIPSYGFTGAAIASVTSITSINFIRTRKLYSLSKVQPLSKNLIKLTFTYVAIICLIYFAIKEILTLAVWMLPLFLVVHYIIFGLTFLFTKSFDQADISMLLAIEKKTGIDVSQIKKLLKRFL